MAYTRFSNGFDVTTSSAIDKRLILTKAEMKIAEDVYNLPPVYFAVCSDNDEDNGKIFVYSSAYSNDDVTGKYRPIDDLINFSSDAARENFEKAIKESVEIQGIKETLGDAQARTGVFEEIDAAEEKIEAVTDRVDVLEPQVTNLEERVDVLQPKVTDLEPRVKKAEEDIAQAEEDIEDIQTWIDNVRLDGGEIKAIYTLTTFLNGVVLEGDDRTIAYRTLKTFEFDPEEGYQLPETILVNSIPVGPESTDCGTTVASWQIFNSDEGKYGSLKLTETTNNITVTITGIPEV